MQCIVVEVVDVGVGEGGVHRVGVRAAVGFKRMEAVAEEEEVVVEEVVVVGVAAPRRESQTAERKFELKLIITQSHNIFSLKIV